MPPETLDSLDKDSLKLLMLELLAQNKALKEQISVLLVRIAGLEARNGQPPKTPTNSSVPPLEGAESQSPGSAGPEEGPQRPAGRRACAVPRSRRDARDLRRELLLRRGAVAGRPAGRLRLRSHRSAADQTRHDTHQSAQGQLPVLQQARRRATARRHGARNAVRSRRRVAGDLSARLPDGQLH